MTTHRALTRLLATLASLVPAVVAAATLEFSGWISWYQFTSSYPIVSDGRCTGAVAEGAYPYETHAFTVEADGTHAIREHLQPYNMAAYVYAGGFDPAAPAANCVAASEALLQPLSAPLRAGVTYTLVVAYAGWDYGDVGYRVSITGPVAKSAVCAGFTDVESASPFCSSVEWMANRAITLGCDAGGTLFCGSQSVTRLQMAAFMQRLGNALSPEVHVRHGGAGTSTVPGEPPDAPLRLCEMQADSTVASYPRRAILNGTMSGLADGNAVAYRVFWLQSTDGGATWGSILDAGQAIGSLRASSPANQWSGAALASALDLPAGTPLRVAMGVRRDDVLSGTTGNFADTRCQATVTILNANGATSPR